MYHTYEKFSSDKGKTPPSFGVKFSIGLASGAVGAFVGTPSEVTLIRMTSDGNAPPSQVTYQYLLAIKLKFWQET